MGCVTGINFEMYQPECILRDNTLLSSGRRDSVWISGYLEGMSYYKILVFTLIKMAIQFQYK